MKKLSIFTIIVLYLFLVKNLLADTHTIQSQMQQLKQRYEQAMNIHKNKYQHAIEKNREYYTKIIASKWGKENVKFSSKDKSVFYDMDLETREIIDFDKGTLTIEKVLEDGEKVSETFIQNKVKQLKDKTIEEALKTDPLQKDIKIRDSKLMAKKLDEFIELDNKNKKIFVKLTKDNTVKVTLNLSKSHMQKRIDLFLPLINKYANQYDLDTSYILAIIYTESRFNPFAISHVPAYGLMQIVPQTAGKDAFEKLYGYEKILSKDYLFIPEQNLELGIKYLQMIRDIYLAGIEDKQSMNHCMAISYNAGMGNLYKAFTGSKKYKDKAIDKINQLDPQEIFEHLKSTRRLTTEANNYVVSIFNKEKDFQHYNIH